MTSQKQIEANRANALLSTGAVTREVKAVVAQNAIKHGIFSKDLVINSGTGKESQEEFLELLNSLKKDLAPNGTLEDLLVEKIAIDFWRLRRVIRFEAGCIKKHIENVMSEHLNPWASINTPLTNEEIDNRTKEIKSYIEWNNKYLSSLEAGIVSFNESTWEGDEIESDIEDDLSLIIRYSDRTLLSQSEKDSIDKGKTSFSNLKKIVAKAGYKTDADISTRLIELFKLENRDYERDIEKLEKQKQANIIAEDLTSKICSLPPADSVDKALKYDKALQRSIFQNLIMLKKLQTVSL